MTYVQPPYSYSVHNYTSLTHDLWLLIFYRVKSENASSLRSVLKDDTRSTTVMETYDLKFVSNEEKVDLRLRNNSGRLEVVMAKKNERKVVVFDMLCLHM